MDKTKEQSYAQKARKTKTAKIVLSLVITLVVVGCLAFFGLGLGSPKDDAVSTSADGIQTVIDSEGRSVEIPADPQSIAIMDAFSGELVVMLGEGENACGMPGGVKSDKMLQKLCPEMKDVASLSGNSVNIESLLDFNCDVALVKAAMPAEERNKLEKVGIPYVVVDYTTMAEQVKAIELVGQVCGADAAKKALDLVAFYQDTVKMVEDKTKDIAPESQLKVYHAINDALLTDSSESLGNDWITKTGCVNVASQEKATNGSDYSTSVEQVYAWDPDVIICNSATATDEFLTNEKWSGLRAVKDGKVYTIPTGATRWGQRGSVETYLAMVWLGVTVYPDLYDDVDLKTFVTSYYQDNLGLEIDDELYESIIAGEDVRTNGSGSGDVSPADDGKGEGTGAGNGSGGGNGQGQAA